MIRLFRIHVPLSLMVLFLSDTAILYGAISLGLISSYATGSDLLHNGGPFGGQQVLYVILVMLSLYAMGLHHRRYLVDPKNAFLRLVASHAIAFVMLTAVFYVLPGMRIWLSALGPAMGLSFVGLFVGRIAFVRLAKVEIFRHRILVLGAGAQARQIEESEKSGRFKCVGFVASDETAIEIPRGRFVPNRGPLADLAAQYGATEIVVALEERRGRLPTEELLACRLRGMQISSFSSFIERETGQVEIQSLDPSWLIFSDGFSVHHRLQRTIKRAFDVIMSVTLLVFATPVVVTAAVAIWIEDRGPVFYRQQRVGLVGRPFMLLKFRSMRPDAESDGIARWAAVRDQRVTRVGSIIRTTRIDEIPQVINVLKGEMSFVGPRPERPAIVDELSKSIRFYECRHMAKPGITGWAQINYPYGASLEDARQKLKHDLYYLKNYSLALDLVILLQTIRVVLWPQGAR